MTRFRYIKDKEIYTAIQSEINRCINENVNFNQDCVLLCDIINNKDLVINAFMDSINISLSNNKNKYLNESIIASGKNVNLYNIVFESINTARRKKQVVDIDIDEGLLGGAIGALAGISFGPAIGKAICNALGIDKGVLYDLLTSKLVNTAVCAKLGLRF